MLESQEIALHEEPGTKTNSFKWFWREILKEKIHIFSGYEQGGKQSACKMLARYSNVCFVWSSMM